MLGIPVNELIDCLVSYMIRDDQIETNLLQCDKAGLTSAAAAEHVMYRAVSGTHSGHCAGFVNGFVHVA